MKRFQPCTLVALFFLLLSSCGDGRLKLAPVQGKLFVDGQPATDAMVFFHPESGAQNAEAHPFAQVQADGSFSASTYVQGDGVPPGRYVLTFTWKEASGLTKRQFEGTDRLRGKYATIDSSSMRIEVKSSPNDLGRIDLTTK